MRQPELIALNLKSLNAMSFTPEQIAAIENIVDRRIMMHRDKQQVHTLMPYHTVPEIRRLIANNEAKLREEFGHSEFDIAVLRHKLAKLTVLREGDLELVGGGGDRAPHQQRWESQVLNALKKTREWPECPIEPGVRRRSYRFIPQLTCPQTQIS